MIWYLLYIFRGTTKPPVLNHAHPLRRAVFLHASYVARHPLRLICVSVVIGVLLCYPFPLLYRSQATAVPILQFQTWSSILPVGTSRDDVDFSVKQAWVFGDYMKALTPEVLRKGKAAEDILTRLAFDGPVNSSHQSSHAQSDDVRREQTDVLFRSLPWKLLYAATTDEDILARLDSWIATQASSNLSGTAYNVLGGIEAAEGRLVTADALVTSLVEKMSGEDSNIPHARQIAIPNTEMYPRDGIIRDSHLYEVQHRQLSTMDTSFIVGAYLCMGIYFMACMRKLRAVKSRFGLAATVLIQSSTAILASFTICRLFNVDLSRMPGQVYPFVVLAIGLENTFRLINVVVATRPEDSAVSRIANALSNVAHVILAGSIQNVVVLALVSRLVNPMTVALCTFAVIGIVIDALFHITFFLAVLSIDIRRMELQDLLDRGRADVQRHNSRHSEDQMGGNIQRWNLLSVMQSKIPFSTRIAGAGTVFFYVVGINSHFTESKSQLTSMQKVVKTLLLGSKYLPPESNLPFRHTESQAKWLMRQDTRFIQQVLLTFASGKSVAIARVYEPLVFLLDNADRSSHINFTRLFPHMPNFGLMGQHLQPILLTIALILTAAIGLLQFLLWNEVRDDHGSSLEAPEPLLSVRTLHDGHTLDVVLLAASPHGMLVSVGFDRRILIWNLKSFDGKDYECLAQDLPRDHLLWPIESLYISNSGETIAVCSGGCSISIYDIQKTSAMRLLARTDPHIRTVAAFFHSELQCKDKETFLSITDDGLLSVFSETGSVTRTAISSGRILSAHNLDPSASSPSILSVLDTGNIILTTRNGAEWLTEKIFSIHLLESDQNRSSITVHSVPSLSHVLISDLINIFVVHIPFGVVLHSFSLPVPLRDNSLRVIHPTTKPCPICGGSSVSSYTIVYTSRADNLQCTLRSYTSFSDNPLCFRVHADKDDGNCTGLDNASFRDVQIDKLSVWEAAGVDNLVGVRVRRTPASSSSSRRHTPKSSFSSSSLRPRKASLSFTSLSDIQHSARAASNNDNDFEAVCIASTGEVTSSPLSTWDDSQSELFVSDLGPVVRVSHQSVAVGFGPSVKLLMLGNERFEGMNGGYGDDLRIGTPVRSRRKPLASSALAANGNALRLKVE